MRLPIFFSFVFRFEITVKNICTSTPTIFVAINRTESIKYSLYSLSGLTICIYLRCGWASWYLCVCIWHFFVLSSNPFVFESYNTMSSAHPDCSGRTQKSLSSNVDYRTIWTAHIHTGPPHWTHPFLMVASLGISWLHKSGRADWRHRPMALNSHQICLIICGCFLPVLARGPCTRKRWFDRVRGELSGS